MYLAVCSRPEIFQAVSELSRFNSNPGLKHWESAMQVLRYFSGTANVGLLYKKGESQDIWGYVDASHTSCPDSNKGRACQVEHLSHEPAREWEMDPSAPARLSIWDSL